MAEENNEQKIGQLQLYEQSLQSILLQKQQFQSQIAEMNSAIKGIKDSENAYKIIGNIMVKTKKDELSKDLSEQKSRAELRIQTLEKQESQIREKVEKLQEEVMSSMKE